MSITIFSLGFTPSEIRDLGLTFTILDLFSFNKKAIFAVKMEQKLLKKFTEVKNQKKL